jgi:hypothetical protein
MATKTERILDNLPRSFRPAPGRSALAALAGAVGGELQQAEVSLARVLRAHWVDSADEGAKTIDDLARIASMWGLAPLRDSDGTALESVEQFREHLKRHVRSVLEGRVTVRGLLQVAAETLGVHIAEGDAVDAWWKRPKPFLTSTEPNGEDAAMLLVGLAAVDVRGADAQPARVRGSVDLSGGANLESGSRLKLQVDDGSAQVIDLAAGVSDLRAVPLPHIVSAINAVLPGVASADDGLLVLQSIRTGLDARLEIEEVDRDAALALLGVPAHIYTGRDPQAAEMRSSLDLSGGVDLGRERFLRLTVDRTQTIEVDCKDPANDLTLLDRIRDAINEALGTPLASHDGQFLTVTSPVTGSQGSVFVREPAAQNCADRVFGAAVRFAIGSDARAATVTSTKDLSGGVDLSERSLVRVGVDGAPPVAVNCAGADPSKTTLEEIVDIFNAAFGPEFVRTDGRVLTFTSRVSGRKGELIFGTVPEGDALRDVVGFGPRVFTGKAAVPASVMGTVDLSGGVDLTGSRKLGLIVDDQPLRVIDLPIPLIRQPLPGERPEDIRRTPLSADPDDPPEVAERTLIHAINAAVGQDLASRNDTQIILTSQQIGADSRIAIVPLDREVATRFLSRAAILDEASQTILGFVERRAQGEDATRARVVGTIDLRFGVDLRENRWLRIALDGGPGTEFPCAGGRAHATTFDDIAAALRANLPGLLVDENPKALTLTSPLAGAASRIRFEPVRAQDALAPLFSLEPVEVRGQDAGSVAFTGTADLSKGVDLPPGASVKIGIDAVGPVEVTLNSGTTAVKRTLSEIVSALNDAFRGAFASHDGRVMTLTSRERGEASMLVFETPTAADATAAVFGIRAPRLYQANEERPALVTSAKDLKDTTDLTERRFLRISVDGAAAAVVDCAVAAADPSKATIEEIRSAINRVFNGLTHVADHRLVLRTPTKGSGSRIALQAHVSGDARRLIFGEVPDETRGTAGAPAEIVGDLSLSSPLNLVEHHHMRLSVDGARPVEIAVAGATAGQTTLDEIVERINLVLPGVASCTPGRQLRLRGRIAGSNGTIAVVPRRFIELLEFPIAEERTDTGPLGSGDRVTVVNTGVAEAMARIELTSLHGTAEPGLVNHRTGRRVTLNLALAAGDRARFEPGDEGLRVTLISAIAEPRLLTHDEVRIEDTIPEPVGDFLALGRGATEWTFLECVGPRFDSARFEEEAYPGFPGQNVGLFDLGRLDGVLVVDQSVFAPVPLPPPSAALSFTWSRHQGGAFDLRLPAELPALFGGRFNEARFGVGVERKTVEIAEVGQAPVTQEARVATRETYPRTVFKPDDDPDHFEKKLAASNLLEVSVKRTNVPIGFVARRAPFREPAFLRPGEFDGRARLFLTEPNSEALVELIAKEPPGEYGTRISVSMRPDGPGRYLLEVGFPGSRFECGRELVLGPAEGAATTAAPGILQAKAAGVRARVLRERTEPFE